MPRKFILADEIRQILGADPSLSTGELGKLLKAKFPKRSLSRESYTASTWRIRREIECELVTVDDVIAAREFAKLCGGPKQAMKVLKVLLAVQIR